MKTATHSFSPRPRGCNKAGHTDPDVGVLSWGAKSIGFVSLVGCESVMRVLFPHTHLTIFFSWRGLCLYHIRDLGLFCMITEKSTKRGGRPGPAKVRTYKFYTFYMRDGRQMVKPFTRPSSASQFARERGYSLNPPNITW